MDTAKKKIHPFFRTEVRAEEHKAAGEEQTQAVQDEEENEEAETGREDESRVQNETAGRLAKICPSGRLSEEQDDDLISFQHVGECLCERH